MEAVTSVIGATVLVLVSLAIELGLVILLLLEARCIVRLATELSGGPCRSNGKR
jgi:hypothetical protein